MKQRAASMRICIEKNRGEYNSQKSRGITGGEEHGDGVKQRGG